MLQANGFATLCLLRWEQSTGGGLLWITEALERLEELGVSSRLLQATLQIVVQPHEVPQVDWFGSWMKSGPLDALQCDHTPKPCCVSSSTARSYTSESPFCLAALVFPEHKLHACTPPEELPRSLRCSPGGGGRIWLRVSRLWHQTRSSPSPQHRTSAQRQ